MGRQWTLAGGGRVLTHRRTPRWAAGAEPVVILALVLAYGWLLRGRGPAVAGIVVLVLASHWWRRETPAALGFRRENFWRCTRACAPVVLVVAALVLRDARPAPPGGVTLGRVLLALAGYTAWGLVQQWALNGYFVNRFAEALAGVRGGGPLAALLAALCFAAAHLPNVYLVGPTLVLGFLSALAYLRYRNLPSLGLAHGVLGALLVLFVARSLPQGLRTGAAGPRAAAQGAGAAAPGCTTAVTRAGLSAASGARIRALRIVTHPPRPFRGPARRLSRFHVRTVAPTVRRELLFAAGDTVDSLRVAESLRRLRNLGFIEDAWLRSTRCGSGPAAAVDLVIETRDAWSTVPEGRWTAAQQTLGIHETNLLGTGRTLSAVLRWDADRLGDSYRFGGQLGLSDPAVTRSIAAGASYVAFADGRAWAVAAGSRRRGIADRWIARGSVTQALRDPTDGVSEQVRRDRAGALVGRRISRADASPTAVYLLAGGEAERTAVTAAAGAALVGPPAVRRSFAGPTVGVALRAARFDTLTWLLPGNGIADIPRGTEAEVVVGGGRDAAARAPAARVDGWVGRVWRPRRGSAVAGDLWAGGYATTARDSAGGGVRAASLRAAVSAFRSAGGGTGLWTLRAGAERRVRPDPDARAFVGLDPTATLVPGELRLARATATVSAERSRHLRPVTRALVLDAAAFGALSRRWRPASAAAGDPVTLGLVGVGVRLAPTRPGQPTAGLDFGYPVLRPGTVAARPVVRVLMAPWFGALRGR